MIDDLLGYAFPGRVRLQVRAHPPHRVEGGACVPHSDEEAKLPRRGLRDHDDPLVLEHCSAVARAIVAALQDLSYVRPDEVIGLL